MSEWMPPDAPFHAPPLLYAISVLGAIALYLLVRPGAPMVKVAGTVLGLGTFAWLLALTVELFSPEPGTPPEAFFVIFSVIALASSVRLISHPRPVYSALYFVMVVLSSAALFLLMGAEFMAFALIIVYAGAILITYMFVLMLAQQAGSPDDVNAQPEYDRVPREPAMAAVMGFLMLALLTSMVYDGVAGLDDPPTPQLAALHELIQLDRMPRELDAVVEELLPGVGAEAVRDEVGRAVYVIDERAFVDVTVPGEPRQTLELSGEHVPSNVQRVGLALVAVFPVSLELAGIILLLAMFGAAVLSRRQIELSEDELREAAGLHRISSSDDADHHESIPGPPGGPSSIPGTPGKGGAA